MPINFICPQCGKQTVVADQFAGQTGPCTQCGALVTVPLGSGYNAGQVAPKNSGMGAVLLVILGVLGVAALICGGIAFLLVLPALGKAREAARRAQSMNQLKQLGLALHNYHDVHQTFPPAVVTDAEGKPLYSGRVLLLPYLEQDHIYRQFNKDKAWDSPENRAVSEMVVDTFCDPSAGATKTCRSDYVFVTGPGTIFDGDKAAKMASITDGTSSTIMMIQTAQGPAHWAEPQDWDASTGRLPDGNYPGVVLVVFADGSVRAMPAPTLQQYVRQLTLRNDGETVPAF